MELPILLLLAGLAGIGFIVGMRWLDAQTWRKELLAFRLRLPAGLKAEDVARWLGTISAEGGSWFKLLDAPPVGIETIATHRGIETYLLVPQSRQAAVLAALRAALPGVRVEDAPDYLHTQPKITAASELRLTSMTRPLAFERAETTVAAYLAVLQPLARNEVVRTQWLFTGSRIPHPARLATEQAEAWPWVAGLSARDREAIQAERTKHSQPLMRACCRIGVTAPTKGQAWSLLHRVVGTLRVMNAPGVSVRARLVPWQWSADGLTRRLVPLLAWPMVLNANEAAGLVGLPVGEVQLPGLSLGAARQLPPANAMPAHGVVVAASNYPGMQSRPLALRRDDRLRHCWIVGPTGAGKSTLLANMICQDMASGDGVVVIDARGDLVPDVLNRVPAHRHDDVIVLDPAQTDRPVGFNVLEAGSGTRELAVDHVLHILHDLYRTSWGPRTADVLRAGLTTLIHTKAPDGSAFTLVELAELLTNPRFRHYVTTQAALPPGLPEFWRWFENLSDAERAAVIGPVLNKVRAFILKRPLRLLLGQSRGLNLTDIFAKRRILMVPLSKGTLGADTTQLVGSLLMASLWQATLTRVRVPVERRRPAWLYADEFQETVRLPIDLADMLAQARGLGLGLTLAHQHLGQLPEAIKSAILGTTRTQVVFQCDYTDATTLSRSFGPLSRDDLMGLERFEIAMRPCVDGRTLRPVTGTTYAMPPATADGKELAARSRELYGVPRDNVEQALRVRVQGEMKRRRVGHVDREARP